MSLYNGFTSHAARKTKIRCWHPAECTIPRQKRPVRTECRLPRRAIKEETLPLRCLSWPTLSMWIVYSWQDTRTGPWAKKGSRGRSQDSSGIILIRPRTRDFVIVTYSKKAFFFLVSTRVCYARSTEYLYPPGLCDPVIGRFPAVDVFLMSLLPLTSPKRPRYTSQVDKYLYSPRIISYAYIRAPCDSAGSRAKRWRN